jgi:cysteine synthase
MVREAVMIEIGEQQGWQQLKLTVGAAIVVVEAPDAIVAVDDHVARDSVREGDSGRAAIVAARIVRSPIPTIEWTYQSTCMQYLVAHLDQL